MRDVVGRTGLGAPWLQADLKTPTRTDDWGQSPYRGTRHTGGSYG